MDNEMVFKDKLDVYERNIVECYDGHEFCET